MTKLSTIFFPPLFFTLFSFQAFSSPQYPDYIIYKGDTLATYTLILEQYFQRQGLSEEQKLFGLSFRDGATFNCWRGYQAIYKIDNDSLFLVEIISCGERRNGNINKAASGLKIKSIFGEKFINGRVFIDWFSGEMKFPLTNKVLRWDGVFYKIFEKERVINILNGDVLNAQDVENYQDDPNRINRKDKNKISNILFRKLKKVNWKNKDDFDCSDKYIVTIDRKGNISKVRMIHSEKEIAEYYEKDEYNFCINKVYEALKSLRFDLIKDKGKPIAEDIYIEIWVKENGKLENWTEQ